MIGELLEDRVVIWGSDGLSLYDEGGFGKPFDNRVELSLVESCYLLEKKKITIKKAEKTLSFKEFYEYAVSKEPEFHQKFVVYRDLRERGYLVKTGFKFGAHFRVYERGVKLKRGPKQAHEHTKFVVHAISEEDRFSYPELSRATRLAQNIRAKMIWAVVDSENDVTYYEIFRVSP
ncbi:MAG: tRNA-intron lyase [Candidatus Aenigmatarchaeota archaeon]|nr:tRNA-intron lyase [Candidatus Aenigmarchaeota archaeon]